jgi:hypothetical protein
MLLLAGFREPSRGANPKGVSEVSLPLSRCIFFSRVYGSRGKPVSFHLFILYH